MTYTANRKLANSARKMFDFDPNSTAATAVGWQSLVDLGGVEAFLAMAFVSVGTGGVGSFTINAATSSTGAGSVAVVTHALGSVPDAVGDYVVLEASEEQIRAALANATHASAVVALVTATDECVVLQERFPMFKQNGSTADLIST